MSKVFQVFDNGQSSVHVGHFWRIGLSRYDTHFVMTGMDNKDCNAVTDNK